MTVLGERATSWTGELERVYQTEKKRKEWIVWLRSCSLPRRIKYSDCADQMSTFAGLLRFFSGWAG